MKFEIKRLSSSKRLIKAGRRKFTLQEGSAGVYGMGSVIRLRAVQPDGTEKPMVPVGWTAADGGYGTWQSSKNTTLAGQILIDWPRAEELAKEYLTEIL